MVRSAERELVRFVGEVQRETALAQALYLGGELVALALGRVWFLAVEAQCAVGAGRACAEVEGIAAVEGSAVDVLCVVDVAAPVDLLHLLQRFHIPYLDLLRSRIAASEDQAVFVIKRFPRNIGAVEVASAAALAQIPKVDDAVPSAGDERVLVDELDCKNSVVVADVVPSGRFQVGQQRFGVWMDALLP